MKYAKTLKGRILNKIEKQGDCWVWVGSYFRKPHGNYGQLRIGGKFGTLKRAHRISYEVFVGEIPLGKEIDHLCHNTMCVNPKHLEAVTHTENMQRRKDSGLPFCKHGHKYTKESTRFDSKGWRRCYICMRASAKRWYSKHHAQLHHPCLPRTVPPKDYRLTPRKR